MKPKATGSHWGSAPDPGILEASTPVSERRQEEKSPAGVEWAGLVPSAHRRPGYSSPGCVPAEPGSTSPGGIIVTAVRLTSQAATIKSKTRPQTCQHESL